MKTLLCMLGLLVMAQGTLAQTPQSRERELLRRAQAALRDLSAERDALRAAEAALKARLAEAESARDQARAEVAAQRAPLQQAQAENQRLQAGLGSTRERAARDKAEWQATLAAREAAWAAERAASQQVLDERTQANRSLGALLERKTAALQDAERRNAELYGLSLVLIERWRHKSPAEAVLHGESLVGIAGVRAEDQAEQWRLQADALSRPAPAR